MMFKNYYHYATFSDSCKKQCYMMCSYTWQMKVTYVLELNWKEYLKCRLSEEFSSRVAESIRLILVKDGFGGNLEALDRWTDERMKDTKI
jgi:hypothetical protein